MTSTSQPSDALLPLDTPAVPVDAPSHGHGAGDASHSEHKDLRLFGLVTFLVADGMTFAGFFAAYLTFRAVNPLPEGSTYELELILPTINTILLVISSVTFHRAGQQLRHHRLGACRAWLLATVALGVLFLAGQMVEYFHLPFGLADNLFASTFYALTGFHGLHVTLGVICMLIVTLQLSESGQVSPGEPFGLEATEIYWHFVDGIWVVLYLLLYLL